MTDDSQLYNNLQALEDASFPKQCHRCGRVYRNQRDFIANTKNDGQSSGLDQGIGDDGKAFVKLIRRCQCGARILDHFGDRRDTSAQGIKRRAAFDKVIASLQKEGLEPLAARQELLNYMHNRPSPILEKLGIFSRR